jgi:hypothetical protein
LKATLLTLLSGCPSAVCLLAGVRRWKRDNAFYNSLNKVRGEGGRLKCDCVSEIVQRTKTDKTVGGLNATSFGKTEGVEEQDKSTEREVMRVYSVRFVPNDPKGR